MEEPLQGEEEDHLVEVGVLREAVSVGPFPVEAQVALSTVVVMAEETQTIQETITQADVVMGIEGIVLIIMGILFLFFTN